MFSLSITLCAAILISVDARTRIVGGSDAPAGVYRYVVAIYTQTANGRFFCGGTLLDTEWVITSGQCVHNAELFTIQLGSNTLTTEDPERHVLATSEYILHPDFDPETLVNDIGLIKFRMPIEYTTYIQPIDLPTWQLDNPIPVSAVGWGQKTDCEHDSELSEHLQMVTVTSISNVECRVTYGSQITDNMVCVVGNYNEGTCIGDIGSPIIEHFGRSLHVVGVATFLSGNGCESTDPSGYTRIYPYYDWVTNVTGITK